MFKKLEVQIDEIKSLNEALKLETEIDVLEGVKDAHFNEQTKVLSVEFDDNLISQDKIFEKIKELGFKIQRIFSLKPSLQEYVYYVKGMHCASCEILIEQELLKIKNIKSVDASTNKGLVRVLYQGEKPKIQMLNEIFKSYGYTFFEKPIKIEKNNSFKNIILPALFVITLFFILSNTPLFNFVNISSTSSLPTFFLLGLFAGFSTCGALVGGLLLSFAKQWHEIYSKESTFFQRFTPYLLFNAARLFSLSLLGGIGGLIGAKVQFSLGFYATLVVFISLLMAILGLQMLGIRYFQRFNLELPPLFFKKFYREKELKGKWTPLLLGASTSFVPCGFTLTAQMIAFLSGSFWQGAAIMFFFTLGTTVNLLIVGFSSVKFLEKTHLADRFLKIAGALVLFFAFYNINSQLNVLGLPSLSDIKPSSLFQLISKEKLFSEKDLPPLVNGKQTIRMKVSRVGFEPNYFRVRAGIPVKWEIENVGASGCTNAIVARDFFSDEIRLSPGTITVKEFTPQKRGKYKFSCWMGMIFGTIEVI